MKNLKQTLTVKITQIVQDHDFSCGCCGTTDCEKTSEEIMKLIFPLIQNLTNKLEEMTDNAKIEPQID